MAKGDSCNREEHVLDAFIEVLALQPAGHVALPSVASVLGRGRLSAPVVSGQSASHGQKVSSARIARSPAGLQELELKATPDAG